MMKPDAFQSAMQSVPLIWEHVDSDNCLQQLLSIHTVLEALSTSKKSLAVCVRDFDDQGRTAESTATQQSLVVLETLIRRFEDFQITTRQHLNLRARSLRETKIGILDLPNEILRNIFDNFRENMEETGFWPGFDYKADTADIQNIRLVCQKFCDVSSHLLIPYLEVSPSRSSLERLDEIMRHSKISEGARVLSIDMSYYSADMAQDLQLFSMICHDKLRNKIESLEGILRSWQERQYYDRLYLGDTDGTAREDDTSEYAVVGDVLREYRRILSVWEEFSNDSVDERIHLDEAALSLRRGHERYRALFQEQDQILQGGHFTRAVAAAMARSHSGGRPNLWLYMSDYQVLPWYHNDRSVHRGTTGMDLSADPDRLIQSEVIQRSPWWHARETEEEEPPQSLLYELPLALRAEGVSLAGFQARINTPLTFNFRMSHDQLSGLREVAETLNVFIFHLREDDYEGPDYGAHPDKLVGFYAYLSAAMGNVPSLSLSIGPEQSFLSIEPLLTSPSWQRLRCVDLSFMNMDIHGLRRFVGMLEQGVGIELSRIRLTSGTWAEALDILRSKAGWGSYVWDPRGAECDVMDEKVVDDIFNHDISDPAANNVSLYIAGVEGVQNPLRRRRAGPQI